MSVIDILQKARDIVSHDGWWVKGALCEGGQVCAMGAIAVADGVFDTDKTGRPEDEVRVDVLKKRVDPDDYYHEDADYAEYIDVDEWFRDYVGDGQLPAAALSSDAVTATCFLAEAFDPKQRAHQRGDFQSCQSYVIETNDHTTTMRDDVVQAFEDALAMARRNGVE